MQNILQDNTITRARQHLSKDKIPESSNILRVPLNVKRLEALAIKLKLTIFTAHQVLKEPTPDGYRMAFVWGSTVGYLNGSLNHIIYSYRCDAIGREIRRMVGKVTRSHDVDPSTSQWKKASSAEDGTPAEEIGDHNKNVAVESKWHMLQLVPEML